MTKRNESTSRLVVQGSVLAIASLVVRLIGFVYRIPLTNMLGEEGMGYYGAAFSIYSFILIISTYAFPAALSKIISKKVALKKYKEAHEIFKAALLLAGVVGLLTSSLMFFQAENIAMMINGSVSTAPSLKALAPALLMFSFLAVFRGYFQGMNTMVPTGISQVIEQIFNAAASLLFGFLLLKQNVEMGAAGGNLGAGFGALFALIFMLLVYYMAKPTFRKRMAGDKASNIHGEALFDNLQIILMTVVPMMLGSTAFHLSNLADTLLFQNGMLKHGYDVAFVASQFGVLTSKYSLMIMLPVSMATALSTATIPSISQSLAKKEYMVIKNKAILGLRVVLMISVPAAFGLASLAEPIIRMLFENSTPDIEATSFLLKIGAVSVVTYSVSSISIAILQGINKIRIPVRNSLIAVGVKIALIFVLIYIFDFGLIGAVSNSILFSFIVGGLNFNSMRKHIRLKVDYKTVLGVPILSGAIMALAAVLIHMMVMALVGSNTLATLLAIAVALVVYFGAMIVFGGITEEILKVVPMGSKVIGISKKFGWM